jgi:LDH2 family malate/lactate/ureidoglycolate dehydrogenase
MLTLKVEQLYEIGMGIFLGLGVGEEDAKCVMDHLIQASLMGHDSHGVFRIKDYADEIKEGKINVRTRPTIIYETATTAIIDGKLQFGQVTAKMGMEVAMRKARENRLGAVGLIHCNHIGRLGAYAQMAAEQGMIGLVMCNSPPGGNVVPYGGKKPLLGTNPIAAGVPAGKFTPFIMDFATSTVAQGKIRIKYISGEKIPLGWIIDKDGNPTDDPSKLYEGGMLLPFGGHKGYALALLIDILAGALTGAGCASAREHESQHGAFMIAINIEGFTPQEKFLERVEEFLSKIKETPAVAGVERVMVPGEPEFEAMEARRVKGIPIPEKICHSLFNLAKETGLNLGKILKS